MVAVGAVMRVHTSLTATDSPDESSELQAASSAPQQTIAVIINAGFFRFIVLLLAFGSVGGCVLGTDLTGPFIEQLLDVGAHVVSGGAEGPLDLDHAVRVDGVEEGGVVDVIAAVLLLLADPVRGAEDLLDARQLFFIGRPEGRELLLREEEAEIPVQNLRGVALRDRR